MITLDKSGGRTIHLFIPFEYNGKAVSQIALAPLRLGHVLRWNEGAWKTSIELMVELSGVDEAVIRELRYPDADRVMEAFMALVTPQIREDITNGQIPLKQPPAWSDQPPPDEEEARITNGGGEPLVAPGVPLPIDMQQPGFDMSEEP